MLTEEEKSFIVFWEERRVREKKLYKQLLVGLPVGFLFGIPVIVNLFSGWYKRADIQVNSEMSSGDFSPMVLMIAVLLIIGFIAIFSRRHKWDMNEQLYQELKSKETTSNQ